MTGSAPLVSVAIPAYRAQDSIGAAVASIRACGLPPDTVEIVIASDDGSDYAPLFADRSDLRFVPPGPVRSGVGPARNRALDAATAPLATYLDADDSWAPGFLADLLPLARAHGAAFAPTRILDNGSELMRLPRSGTELSLATLGQSGASYRPLVVSGQMGRFRDAVAQDIFHAAEILALFGGRCPLGTVPYDIVLGPESVSAAGDYSDRIEAAYATYAAAITAGESRVPPAHISEAAAAFQDRIALNQRYRQQGRGERFYHFLARISA